jgi:hypothetical protein
MAGLMVAAGIGAKLADLCRPRPRNEELSFIQP